MRSIARSFSKAADRYNLYATLQNTCAHDMISACHKLKIRPRRILDLGAGTGILTRLLQEQFPQADILAVDLSYQMLLAHQHGHRVLADAAHLPIIKNSMDLITANLCWQWLQSPVEALLKTQQYLQTGGYLVINTLLDGSLRTWHERLQEHGFGEFQRQYLPLEDWQCLSQAILIQKTYSYQFSTTADFLQQMHALGATAHTRQMPVSGMRRLLNDSRPLAIDYHVLTVTMRGSCDTL